jgi:putative hemolysin
MKIIATVLALFLLSSCSGVAQEENRKATQKRVGIPNPASVKCVGDGHKLEIRTGPGGGQIGVCIDADGNECEEWAYFRGECKLSEKSPRQ